MKEVNCELVESGDKYYLLVPLYNKWHTATMFRSTGVDTGEEYEELVSYCKQNKKETLHFFLDLIDCYAESTKEGTRADDCVGHFLCVLDEVYPDMWSVDGYVGFKQIQKLWKTLAVAILNNQVVELKDK